MPFYVNRTGAPEGPYADEQIVGMIRNGQLTNAVICAVGQNQWVPLNSYPMFAQALSYGAPPQAGYGPPGTQPGYAAPSPTQQGYGPPPAQAAYGAPPATGYGPPPGAGYGPPPGGAYGAAPGYAAAQGGAPAKKSGGKGLIILGVVALLALMVVGASVGAYLMFFRASGAKLAETVPRDTQLFIELPSVKNVLSEMRRIKFIDPAELDDKKLIEQSIQDVTAAFEVSELQAKAFVLAFQSGAVAVRALDKQPEGAMLMGFASAAPVEAFLASKRFTAAGAFGQTGKKYRLQENTAVYSTASPLRKALSAMSLDGTREALVWFPSNNLLVAGSESMITAIAQVLEQDSASLEKNEVFTAAREAQQGETQAFGFVDTSVFSATTDPKQREFIDNYFKAQGPLTFAMRIQDAGVLFDLTAHLSGNKLPKDSAAQPATKLDLAERLPAETFAYVAYSAHHGMTGEELKQTLFSQVSSADPRSGMELQNGIAELEKHLGVRADKLLESIGTEGALAFQAAPDFAVQPNAGPETLANFSVLFVQSLKDDAPLKELAKQLKDKLGPGISDVSIRETGNGFVIEPRSAALPVSAEIQFVNKKLTIAAGGKMLVARSLAALNSGQSTLKTDVAHQATLAALPNVAQAYVWVDTGRITNTLLRSPMLAAQVEQVGMNMKGIRLTGDQRVTTAMSVTATAKAGVWTYQIQALNLPALGSIAAIGTLGAMANRGGLTPPL